MLAGRTVSLTIGRYPRDLFNLDTMYFEAGNHNMSLSAVPTSQSARTQVQTAIYKGAVNPKQTPNSPSGAFVDLHSR